MYDDTDAEATVVDGTFSSEDKKSEDVEAIKMTLPVPDSGVDPESHPPGSTELMRLFKRAALYTLVLTMIVGIIVPLPIFFSEYVFSKRLYAFWAACTIIWAAVSGSCVILPVWESREEIWSIQNAAEKPRVHSTTQQ